MEKRTRESRIERIAKYYKVLEIAVKAGERGVKYTSLNEKLGGKHLSEDSLSHIQLAIINATGIDPKFRYILGEGRISKSSGEKRGRRTDRFSVDITESTLAMKRLNSLYKEKTGNTIGKIDTSVLKKEEEVVEIPEEKVDLSGYNMPEGRKSMVEALIKGKTTKTRIIKTSIPYATLKEALGEGNISEIAVSEDTSYYRAVISSLNQFSSLDIENIQFFEVHEDTVLKESLVSKKREYEAAVEQARREYEQRLQCLKSEFEMM